MSVRDVALSHASAVLEHTEDFWGLDLGRVHLTRMDGKADRRTAGASVHRGLIVPGDVVEVRDVRVTAPARSLLELTTMATVESALVSVNACLHAGTVTLADLESRYANGFFRWRDTQTTDLVLRLASPLPESVGETRAFYLMYRQGIPAPEMQYDVHLPNGESLGRLDFAWPELGIWLEFDGRQKYEKFLRPGESPGDAVFREKQREDRIRAATGWICIRITWADLGRPAWVAEQFWRAVHLRRGAA